jgi:hypothetical protein
MRKSAKLRAELETRIEEMIALLDRIDGDVDLEPETDRCEFEDDRYRHHAHYEYCDDFEAGTWPDNLDQTGLPVGGGDDAEPDEGDEDSLVPATGGVRLARVPRNVHGDSLADQAHRDAERARWIANGSGRVLSVDYGPFNGARNEFRIVARNYDPQRRVRA